MKNFVLMAVISYAVLLGAPRNERDLSILALKAALFFAQIGVILGTPASGYDAGAFEEPSYPHQDA